MGDSGRWEDRIQRALIFAGNQKWIFDAWIRENHHYEQAITTRPVATGAAVSDHTYPLPWHLEIEVGVSEFARGPNTPIPDDPFASTAGRVIKALDMFITLKELGDPFQIQTGMRLLSNAMIATIDVEQTARTASAAMFRVGLQEVIRKGTQTVTYPPRADKVTTNQASKKTAQGQKTTPQTQQPALQSILKGIFSGDDAQRQQALDKLASGGAGTP